MSVTITLVAFELLADLDSNLTPAHAISARYGSLFSPVSPAILPQPKTPILTRQQESATRVLSRAMASTPLLSSLASATLSATVVPRVFLSRVHVPCESMRPPVKRVA